MRKKGEPPKASSSKRRCQSLHLLFLLFLPHRTTAFLAARYRAASASGENVPAAAEAPEEEEADRISSSRRGTQSEAAASATIAPGARQIESGRDKAAAWFRCF